MRTLGSPLGSTRHAQAHRRGRARPRASIASRDQRRAAGCEQHQHAAADGAGQDGQEGAHLDQRVALDQLIARHQLRQDAVLHGPEKRRVHAHQEQRRSNIGQSAALTKPYAASARCATSASLTARTISVFS